MRDIETRTDIDLLLRNFYTRAMSDGEIGYLFTEVAQLDLDEHLPVIGDFWDSLLLGAGNYQRHQRQPMLLHIHLHQKSPLHRSHFERWLVLFEATIDESFRGRNASNMKMRARAIANRFYSVISTLPPEPGADPGD